MQNAGSHTLNDYRKAIAALNESTDIIEIQVKTIETALHTVSNHRLRTDKSIESPTRIEQQQVSTLVENLKRDLHDENALAADKLGKKLSSSFITIADILRRDDHTLDQLESLTKTNHSGSELDKNRQDAVLDALRYALSEVIRTRLNRVYLEASAHDISNGLQNRHDDRSVTENFVPASTKQVEDIKADLRSLYGEVDDVAQMRVNHEHTDQLARTTEQLNGSQRRLSRLRTEKTLQQLQTKTEQLEQIAAHCEAVQSQCLMQQRLEVYLEEISDPRYVNQKIASPFSSGSYERGDGPALAALREYLNVRSNPNRGSSCDGQAKQAFDEYVLHMERKLGIRNQQKDLLGRNDVDGKAEVLGKSSNEARLDELDAHIAKLKNQIENLSMQVA